MRKLLISLLAAIALPSSINAEVDPKVHKLCLPAADYLGCIKGQLGNLAIPSRVINQQGASIIEGNACPRDYAYAGGGYCKNVVEKRMFAPLRELQRYGWVCEKTLGLCNRGHVDWGELTERAYYDPKCPSIEPGIGAPNSCAVPKEKKKKPIKEKKKPVKINCNSPVWKRKPICN